MAENTSAGKAKSGATISGRVYSASGALLNGAKVTCSELETLTLADGYYSFKNVPLGTYEVTVSLQGYQMESKTISLKNTDPVVVDFHLDEALGTARIRGIVYDETTNEPITNTGSVILVLPISNRYSPIDKDGVYEFIKLSEGSYHLVTSIPEYHDINTVVSVDPGETKTHDFLCKKTHIVDPAWG